MLLATPDLSCWSTKSTWIIHSTVTELAKTHCSVDTHCRFQYNNVLPPVVKVCNCWQEKTCPQKHKHPKSSGGSTWAQGIVRQQQTRQVFTWYDELHPTQFSLQVQPWITWNWGNKKMLNYINHKLKKKTNQKINEKQWAATKHLLRIDGVTETPDWSNSPLS